MNWLIHRFTSLIFPTYSLPYMLVCFTSLLIHLLTCLPAYVCTHHVVHRHAPMTAEGRFGFKCLDVRKTAVQSLAGARVWRLNAGLCLEAYALGRLKSLAPDRDRSMRAIHKNSVCKGRRRRGAADLRRRDKARSGPNPLKAFCGCQVLVKNN